MPAVVVCLLLGVAAAAGQLAFPQLDARMHGHGDTVGEPRSHARRHARKQLLEFQPADPDADLGATYTPEGGKGSWEFGGTTGCIMIHANLMKGGEVVGWSARNQGMQEYGSTVYDPAARESSQLLDECGIHDCKESFCGAQTTTANNEVLIFGGHAGDIKWFRSYDHAGGSVWSTQMSSGRWYPTSATLPDGRVLVVGGVNLSGKAGYWFETWEVDNPSYEVYDPVSKSFSGDKWDMQEQLSAAFPINTYPHVLVLPDGSVAVSAGKLLVNYERTGPDSFQKAFSYPSRPGAPWSYPQTGTGVLLPISPPYSQVYFLAAGGSSEDRANKETPASNKAQIIELTGGTDASWVDVGPMPIPRIMGDALILCDGTIGYFGGATKGIAGWSKEQQEVNYKDGSSWYCEDQCSKADDPIYEPTLFNPATGMWSEVGSLSHMERPRLYHGTSLLLQDCTVMVAGSDVTWDHTAEIFSPPYLSKGPRPVIESVPSSATGSSLMVSYSSEDPVTRALLIRTGAVTHSMNFDARAVWLEISSDAEGQLSLLLPSNRAVLPPGMYMLVLLSDKGVPSVAEIISVT